jgi:hypothetical protein
MSSDLTSVVGVEVATATILETSVFVGGGGSGVGVLVGSATGGGDKGVSVGSGASVACLGGKLAQLAAVNTKINIPKKQRARNSLLNMGTSFVLGSSGRIGNVEHRWLCISYHLFAFLASVCRQWIVSKELKGEKAMISSQV